ncbi:MAG: hypothetical protein K5905_12440 [Roseibium sp.]|uniref:hypothetical protein n=1 Tax=Roseibium sp. TaxID=1936156 RepID=UPI0026168F7A|nr:hypothetical protein [Roseibium sp.]MCV0426276.1 hypothetical protein [Roseibium sp.]
MADYYSILKKTIASLPESNGAARRSVYSRARNAIVNQLKAYEPPLSPSEITAEQLRLEEAIRKVEAEAARESLGLSPAAPNVDTPAQPVEEPKAAESEPEKPESGPDEDPVSASPQSQEPEAEDSPASEETIPSPLKDTLSEAETLGTAANKAVQNAKDAVEPADETAPLEDTPPRQEPVFNDPRADDNGLFEPVSETEAQPAPAADTGAKEPETPAAAPEKPGRAKGKRPSASDALRSGSSSNKAVPIAIAAVLALLVVGAGAYFFLSPEDQVAVTQPQSSETETATTEPVTSDVTAETSETPEDSSKNTDRLLDDGDNEVVAPDARTVTTTTIDPETLQPGSSEPAIVTGGENEPASGAPATSSSTGAETPSAVPEGNLAAIAPEEAAPSAPSETTENGVQRSILYEEGEDAGGAGTAAQGAVAWDVEEVTDLDGQVQAILNAVVEIPERDVKVDIRIKPNDDTSLPASHLVEITYEFPDSFAAGDVVNVPGLVMKPTEEARGDALIGASVKVSPGIFWIALSSLPNEQERNLALLRERGWIDIPMLYENGKRGILTLEKGSAGADAVEKAITAWQAG